MSSAAQLYREACAHRRRFEDLYLGSLCLWLRPARRRRIREKTLPMAWRRTQRRHRGLVINP